MNDQIKQEITSCPVCGSDLKRDVNSTGEWYQCTNHSCVLWAYWNSPEQLDHEKKRVLATEVVKLALAQAFAAGKKAGIEECIDATDDASLDAQNEQAREHNALVIAKLQQLLERKA